MTPQCSHRQTQSKHPTVVIAQERLSVWKPPLEPGRGARQQKTRRRRQDLACYPAKPCSHRNQSGADAYRLGRPLVSCKAVVNRIRQILWPERLVQNRQLQRRALLEVQITGSNKDWHRWPPQPYPLGQFQALNCQPWL